MTNGAAGTASRALRLNVPQRIMMITAALAAVAVALFVIVVRPLPGAPTALNLPWVLWAVAFAAAEAFPVHVQVKKDSHTFSISDLVLAAGLVLTTPAPRGRGPAGRRRRRPVRAPQAARPQARLQHGPVRGHRQRGGDGLVGARR